MNMHVMQYEITLPADYDMKIIEQRVATRGRMTDAFPHLGLKAYAVRRRGRHDSTVNAYAPFYYWRDPRGMIAFLHQPFAAIVQDFSRPRVQHWIATAFHRGPDFAAVPVFATKRTQYLSDQLPPGPAMGESAAVVISQAGVHSHAVALDPNHWNLVHFTLWTQLPDISVQAGTTVYDVLHASTPECGELAVGWLG